MEKIAKFRNKRFPGYWLLTDFTMEQIERRLESYEQRIFDIKSQVKNLKEEWKAEGK